MQTRTIRKQEGALKNINASLKNIKKTIEILPKINFDTLEKMKLAEQKKKKKWKLWKKLLIFIVPMLFIYLLYIIVYPNVEIQKKSIPIRGFIKYPRFLFVNDIESIELTLINTSEKNNIEKIKFFLKYPPEAFIKFMSNNGSSITQFDVLDTEESKTKTVKFQLNNSVGFFKTIKLTLKITNKTMPDIIERTYPIVVIPIPQFKSFTLLFLTYLVTAIIMPIFSKKVKKLLEEI